MGYAGGGFIATAAKHSKIDDAKNKYIMFKDFLEYLKGII